MTDDRLFAIANAVPMLGWLALALSPLRRELCVTVARVVAVMLAVAYTLMVAAALLPAPGRPPLPDLTTLAGLASAFAQPHVMLVGWVHYLAFDLWAGAWEAEEAGRRGLPHLLVLPCLALTLLAGPAGLVLFLLVRAAWRPRADPRRSLASAGR